MNEPSTIDNAGNDHADMRPLVVYASASRHKSQVGRHALWLREYWTVTGALLILALVVALVPGPDLLRLGIGLVAAGAFYLCMPRLRAVTKDETTRWITSVYPDPSARVACVGTPKNLALFARRGPVQDLAFEPSAFLAPLGLPLRGREVLVWTCTSIVMIGVLLALFYHITRSGMGYAAHLTGIAAGGFITAAIWPVYLRVVPGRLDILRYNTLGRTVSEIVKHDLRTSAVLVDLNQRCVFLAKDGITTEIGFGAVRDPYEFAHAVLTAAVSTHQPAPLPDDALIG